MSDQIDPSALSRPITTPILPPKSLITPSSASKPAKSMAGLAPRIELEAAYMSLKAAVGDNWGIYKEAISLFLCGQLNQAELSSRIDWFLMSFSGETEHLHNELIVAILANIQREPPDQIIAPWVSENDKPTAGPGAKAITGDAAEQRIKLETMNLPNRDRRRIKDLNMNDPEAYDGYLSLLGDHYKPKSKTIHEVAPASAGGLTNLHKTNWDLEIRKRYTQPLGAESGEFPDTSTIESRMLPICYENGLLSGHNADASQFMAVATETFIKQFLSAVFDKTRSNGPGAGGSAGSGGSANWVTSYKYRKQLEKEEEQWLKGEMQRDKIGLLPSEAKAAGERGALGMADLHSALSLGNCGIGQMPMVVETIMLGYREGELETWNDYTIPDDEGYVRPLEDVIMTGTSTHLHEASGRSDVEDSEDEEDHWGWEGAAPDDKDGLMGVLDSILAV